jgi:tetratricopeptide (TPR) repeat protein
MRALAGIPDVIREYQGLMTHEGLRAEIELHLGGLESRLMRPSRALEHLRRVPDLTNEPYLLYLSQLLTGRTLHNAGDTAGAAAAFERAVAIVPNARAAATWLAAELLMSESASERDRAYPLLEAAYIREPTADPWRLYLHGDARLWPAYMAQLRKALQ